MELKKLKLVSSRKYKEGSNQRSLGDLYRPPSFLWGSCLNVVLYSGELSEKLKVESKPYSDSVALYSFQNFNALII